MSSTITNLLKYQLNTVRNVQQSSYVFFYGTYTVTVNHDTARMFFLLSNITETSQQMWVADSLIGTSASQQFQFTWRTGVNERNAMAYNFSKKIEP
jgi:hypothetical protein